MSLILISSCSPEVRVEPNRNAEDKITFIGHHQEPDGEFVLKKMIRNSISEDEYILFKDQDTLVLNSKGRTFFMVGERNRVLDTVIVDRGDVVTLNYNNDSLEISSTSNTITNNIEWYNDFHDKVEEDHLELFKEIKLIPKYYEELRKPLVLTNDFEIIELSISHIYDLDRVVYNQNKVHYDKLLQGIYVKTDSLIDNTELDVGAKEILKFILHNSTIDKFRRMGATVQDWL